MTSTTTDCDLCRHAHESESGVCIADGCGCSLRCVVVPEPRRLTKQEIRAVLNEHRVRHTTECRAQNPRGVGGNPRHPLGGYVCSCDWMNVVRALAARALSA